MNLRLRHLQKGVHLGHTCDGLQGCRHSRVSCSGVELHTLRFAPVYTVRVLGFRFGLRGDLTMD